MVNHGPEAATPTTGNVVDLLVRTMTAFQNGDVPAAAALMHPDIRWHSPGRTQPAAGTHTGRDNVLASFKIIANQPGTLSLEVLDILSGQTHGGLLYIHRRQRGLDTLEARICLIATASGSQLAEVWEHIYDPHTFDVFYTQA
jgi:ketosteroid isomerase-like protein